MEFQWIMVFISVALLPLTNGEGNCPTHTFGDDCHPCNCREEIECDQKTGQCEKCYSGYHGLNCSLRMPNFHNIKFCVLSMKKFVVSAQFNLWDPSMGGIGPVEKYNIQRKRTTNQTSWEWRDSIRHADGATVQRVHLLVDAGVEYLYRIYPSVRHLQTHISGPAGPAIAVRTQPDLSEEILQKFPDDIKCQSDNNQNKTSVGQTSFYMILVPALATALVCVLVSFIATMFYCRYKKRHNSPEKPPSIETPNSTTNGQPNAGQPYGNQTYTHLVH